jgi:hypothetical protein
MVMSKNPDKDERNAAETEEVSNGNSRGKSS